MKRVLVTAFEPFGGDDRNPSLEVATRLRTRVFSDIHLETVELAVDRDRAVVDALAAIDRERPDVVIMLGVAGGRYRINPERVAINIDDYRIPDNAGNMPDGEPVVAGGPVGYFSTLPLKSMVRRLNESGIPASISNSAGTYLCNRLFYSVMHHLSLTGLTIPAGFIHLPYLESQVAAREADFPCLSLETMCAGIELAIDVAAREEADSPIHAVG